MALIACFECQKTVSDNAASCPHCGAPITDTYSIEESERTPKIYKAQYLCASLLIFVCFVLFVSATIMQAHIVMKALALLGFLCGVAWYITVRVAFWWNNG